MKVSQLLRKPSPAKRPKKLNEMTDPSLADAALLSAGIVALGHGLTAVMRFARHYFKAAGSNRFLRRIKKRKFKGLDTPKSDALQRVITRDMIAHRVMSGVPTRKRDRALMMKIIAEDYDEIKRIGQVYLEDRTLQTTHNQLVNEVFNITNRVLKLHCIDPEMKRLMTENLDALHSGSTALAQAIKDKNLLKIGSIHYFTMFFYGSVFFPNKPLLAAMLEEFGGNVDKQQEFMKFSAKMESIMKHHNVESMDPDELKDLVDSLGIQVTRIDVDNFDPASLPDDMPNDVKDQVRRDVERMKRDMKDD